MLVTTDAIGGVWTFTVDLARALGERVDVFVAIEGGHPSARQARELDEAGIRWASTANKLEWMDDPWDEVDATGTWLAEIADGFGADLLHLNSYAHAARGWELPVLVTAHSCVLSWWKDVKGEMPPRELATYRERVRAGLAAADLVTAPTRALLRDIQTFYGRLKSSHVIANGSGVDAERATKEPLVVSAGRMWDEAKNLAILEDVAPRIAWPLVACGDGSESARNVRGMGRVPRTELLGLFARASIFCGPARYEPFGLSALEAARSGCALILGDIASLREVWQDGATFVPPNDASAIASAIEELTADPVRLAARARRARERAATFTVERMAGAYLESYARLLNEGRLRDAGAMA